EQIGLDLHGYLLLGGGIARGGTVTRGRAPDDLGGSRPLHPSVEPSSAESTDRIAVLPGHGAARSALLRHLRPQALLLLPQLGRERVAEVLRLKHLSNLDLGLAVERIGAALNPFDRLRLRLHLNHPEAGDQLLGLGEGAIGHNPLLAGETDTRALR